MPEIQMPKLSDTMTEGTLVAWKKKKGDKVSAGDVIAEIETDKATMEWESPEDGTLTEIYVEEGGKVNVGDKIAFIGGEGEAAPAEKKEEEKKAEPEAKEEKKAAPKKKAQAETEKPAPAEEKEEADTAPPRESKKEAKPAEQKKSSAPAKPAAEAKAETGGEARVKASPLARRVAAELGRRSFCRQRHGPRRPRHGNRCARGCEVQRRAASRRSPDSGRRRFPDQSYRNAQSDRGKIGREQRAGAALLSEHRDRCRSADECAGRTEIGGRRSRIRRKSP